jgi:hypothetical protein
MVFEHKGLWIWNMLFRAFALKIGYPGTIGSFKQTFVIKRFSFFDLNLMYDYKNEKSCDILEMVSKLRISDPGMFPQFSISDCVPKTGIWLSEEMITKGQNSQLL